MASTQLGLKMLKFRSDWGGEFMSREFDECLSENGALRQLTVPKTSQQNGVAERRNRTLANTARCLLIDSGLPIRFWDYAVLCANFLVNRRTTRANADGKTPHERWWGKAPECDYLRTFGCNAQTRANWEERDLHRVPT